MTNAQTVLRHVVRVQSEDFDVATLYGALASDASAGAVVMFVGKVRDLNLGERVSELFLEHYPGMTESVLEGLVESARNRWELGAILVVHRVGALTVNDQIVFVGVTSKHREDAFIAAEFLMDKLKTQAPFWKHESSQAGSQWLDENAKDQVAAKRWDKKGC
jgi:molybdopterin synthase catalytic subunit